MDLGRDGRFEPRGEGRGNGGVLREAGDGSPGVVGVVGSWVGGWVDGSRDQQAGVRHNLYGYLLGI